MVVSVPQLIFMALEVFSAGQVTMEKMPFVCAARVKDAEIARIDENTICLMDVLKFMMNNVSVESQN